ncbi:MAG: LysE family translocator [Gammaproteobacteria bacterium]|nr:MAG: LysE family translocator [Gammaproteobacteria bacterium]
MPITNFSLFFSITFIVSASPGPVMLSCMTNGGRLGMRKAMAGMLGACAGNLVLVALSALGLGLIVSQNDLLFNIVKWGGAGYLAFLGVQIIRTPINIGQVETDTKIYSAKSVGWNSFFIAISNPKGLIYFGALFPQFINYHQPLVPQFLVLTLTFLITDFLWMFAYAIAGNKIMRWLKAPKHQLWFNTISGLILIAAGIFMALSGKA